MKATIPILQLPHRWRCNVAFFGSDFIAARKGALYEAQNGQHPLLAVGFAIVLFATYSILQGVMGVVVHLGIYGSFPALQDFGRSGTFATDAFVRLTKCMIIGILPAALLATFASWWLAKAWNKTGDRGIPLQLPSLGFGGWLTLIVGFVIAMTLVFNLTYVVLGIDPKDYMPSPGGIDDGGSSAGLMEKIIADMADEPLLFALALPGIAFGAPLLEEFLFRGALFSSLRKTWLKAPGAVLVTSAAWALVHGSTAPWLFVGIIFIMGLLLGAALLRFGSLWVTIILHSLWNGLVSLSMLTLVQAS